MKATHRIHFGRFSTFVIISAVLVLSGTTGTILTSIYFDIPPAYGIPAAIVVGLIIAFAGQAALKLYRPELTGVEVIDA